MLYKILIIIDEETNESKYKPVSVLKGFHTRPIYSVSWSKLNNKIATCGGDNYIRVFELVSNLF